MTRRISWPCGDFSSSTPAPEISDTYPGTSGSTQGERKEIKPAMNAAMGSGRPVTSDFIVPAGATVRDKTPAKRFSCKVTRQLQALSVICPAVRHRLSGRCQVWQLVRGFSQLSKDAGLGRAASDRPVTLLAHLQAVEDEPSHRHRCLPSPRTVPRCETSPEKHSPCRRGCGHLRRWQSRLPPANAGRPRAEADAGGYSWRKLPGRPRWEKQRTMLQSPAMRFHARHNPNRAGELHALVITTEQGRAAERRRQPPGAVDHAADHRRVIVIGGCDRIDSEDRDAERASVERNGEDVD